MSVLQNKPMIDLTRDIKVTPESQQSEEDESKLFPLPKAQKPNDENNYLIIQGKLSDFNEAFSPTKNSNALNEDLDLNNNGYRDSVVSGSNQNNNL